MARPLATRAHILGARCGLSTLGAHRPSFWFVLGCPGARAPRWSKHIPIPPPPRPRRGASRLRLAASPSPPPHPPPPPTAGAGAARVRRVRDPRAGDHRPVSCALARALQVRTAFSLCGARAGASGAKPPLHHSPRAARPRLRLRPRAPVCIGTSRAHRVHARKRGTRWFVRTGGRPRCSDPVAFSPNGPRCPRPSRSGLW
ncbi:hypothetical protein PVAP13_5NG012547 [Panicum virgatum]|uniref:Uncharacterized protein n=1 Tax=Panicum virgatum TaxID=38727 RepID=A0A8T0S6F3_PANVG|nr:hypothetical protein PVAP13_5NG012547 [Panicum virgatum]